MVRVCFCAVDFEDALISPAIKMRAFLLRRVSLVSG